MTRFPRLFSLATLLLVGLAALASPPPKPNLSGKWVANFQKSDFGPVTAPKSRTDEITQAGSHFTLSRSQVSVNDIATTVKVDCVIGGGDCTATHVEEGDLKAKAFWDGNALVIDSVLSTEGVEVKVHDVYTLSAGGKVLTIKRHIVAPNGEGDQTVVLEKQ